VTGRRAAGALTAGLLTVAVLAGCSGGDDDQPAPTTPSETSAPPPISPSGTVTPPTTGLPGTLTPGPTGSGIPIPSDPQN
jgi:hypothetical protein